VDTVDGWYRRRHALRGLPSGETGAVAVIQRANSDLRLNPHIYAICLDGVYSADRDGKGLMFHPAPSPSQEDIESLVGRASRRILRFLQRRKVITLVTGPGDGEVTVVGDDTMGQKDPLLAKLLAGAVSPFAGRVSHPLDEIPNFMNSSHDSLLSDQPFLVAPIPLCTGTIATEIAEVNVAAGEIRRGGEQVQERARELLALAHGLTGVFEQFKLPSQGR